MEIEATRDVLATRSSGKTPCLPMASTQEQRVINLGKM